MKYTVQKAFLRSVPVMAGYIVLGIGFGILVRNNGYGVVTAFAMSLFIYAGSMQYAGIGLIAGGASALTAFITTIALRAIPFLLFRDEEKTPSYMIYLGRVLPQAAIGMLVVYCLKDISFKTSPFGVPEMIGGLAAVFLQIWKRNMIVSILGATLLYMVMVQWGFAL